MDEGVEVGWRWGLAGWGPEGQDPNTQWWGPEISVFPHFRFFLVLGNLHVSFFSLFLFSWIFGGVLVGRDLKCAVVALRLSCESPWRPAGRQGLSHNPRAKTSTFEGPSRPNTTKIPREDPHRERKKGTKMGAGEENKARKFGRSGPAERGLGQGRSGAQGGQREREGEQEVGRGSGAGEGRRRVGRLGCLQGGTSTGP